MEQKSTCWLRRGTGRLFMGDLKESQSITWDRRLPLAVDVRGGATSRHLALSILQRAGEANGARKVSTKPTSLGLRSLEGFRSPSCHSSCSKGNMVLLPASASLNVHRNADGPFAALVADPGLCRRAQGVFETSVKLIRSSVMNMQTRNMHQLESVPQISGWRLLRRRQLVLCVLINYGSQLINAVWHDSKNPVPFKSPRLPHW